MDPKESYTMSTSVSELFSLKGRVAMVTGGARHLGYDMAEALGESGCNLVITSRSRIDAEHAADRLRQACGNKVLALALDVCDEEQVDNVVREAADFQGRLDILVNNAGGGAGAGVCDFFQRSARDMKQLIETNLLGTLYCCQHAGRIMVNAGQGKIVNIASIAGIVGRDRRMYERCGMNGQPIDYAAAKAGVLGITRDLAGLLSPMGLQVNAISPGGFGPRQIPDTFVREYSNRTPMGRMGRDGVDLKGAVVYLASAASDYVTGQNLVVDGGFSIWQ